MSDEALTVGSLVIPALEQALGERAFANFEETTKGEILLNTGLTFRRTKFKMRIGLHLNRPTQAIIAEGHFVRMRAAPEYADYELKVLDANNPDNCLYEQLIAEVAGKSGGGWLPRIRKKFWSVWSGTIWHKRGGVISNDPTS